MQNKKINILHLIYGLNIGGAEMALYYYIRALGNINYQHYVYCLRDSGPIKKRIEKMGAIVKIGKYRNSIKEPIKFFVSSIRLLSDIRQFVISNHIQIVQSHSGQANQIGILTGILTQIPSFPTVHSTMAFNFQKNSSNRIALIFKNLVNHFLYRRAYRVVCVSDRIKNIVENKFNLNENKIIILKNGIVKSKNMKLVRSNSSNNITKFICVGRLVPSKGFDLVIEAVARILNEKKLNFILSIAGDGEEKKNLARLIKIYNLEKRVFLLGERHDVESLLEKSDIFILPSKFEGLSISMIEAMSCGLPIIASNSPGINDFIIDGKNGLLFNKNDIEDLKEKIFTLMENESLRSFLSYSSKIQFSIDYDMNKNIQPLKKIFRNVATPH